MVITADPPVAALPRSRLRAATDAFKRALLAQRPGGLVRWALAAVLVASALLHLAVMLASTGAAYDIASYRIQAHAFFTHQNVYLATQRYPYPPVWIWLVALAQWVATTLHLPFDQVVKVPGVLADLGIAALIAALVRARYGWCWYVVAAAALYALNPVAVLVSAGHGQFDALAMAFVLVYLVLRERPIPAGLALGVAIALKGFPVLLLPYAVQTAPRGRRLALLASALAPLAVSVLLYGAVFRFTPAMLTHVAGYRSTPAFGWSYFLFQIPAVYDGIASNNATVIFLVLALFAVSEIFILTLAVLEPGKRFATRPAAAATLVFAAFFAGTTTMSVQYLVWLLPVLILALPGVSVMFTGVALLGAATFYAQDPGALGSLPTWLNGLQPLLGMTFLRGLGVAAIIACSVYVLVKLLKPARQPSPGIRQAATSGRSPPAYTPRAPTM